MRIAMLIGLIGLAGCTPQPQLPTTSSTNPYNGTEHPLPTKVKVYHHTPDSTLILVSIPSEKLLYTRKYQSDAFRARFRVKYLTINVATNQISDSASHVFADTRSDKPHPFVRAEVPILSNYPVAHRLEVLVTDLNKHTEYNYSAKLVKDNPLHAQHFLIEKATGAFLNDHILNTDAQVFLKSHTHLDRSLDVMFFNLNTQLPPPPFSNAYPDLKMPSPDSIFPLTFEDRLVISLPKLGVYHLFNDSLRDEGMTIRRFRYNFPKVQSPELLIEPLRYLTSKKEYADLKAAEEPRSAVDAFWMEKGGSSEQSRQLMQTYYGRVEASNKYFTTFREGWMTDRGLIYIIFGPPERVDKRTGREHWYYGRSHSSETLSFTFVRKKHPLSGNVFVMERSIIYKSHWYQALDSWRAGRVYRVR